MNVEVSTHKLNPSQEKALRTALDRKLSLIQGPPGRWASQPGSTGREEGPKAGRSRCRQA